MNKTNRNEKFRRLSQNRMTRIFKTMNLIANLSNQRYYNFSNEEISELFETYISEGEKCKLIFESQDLNKEILKSEFKFSTLLEEDANPKRIKFRELSEQRMSKVLYDLKLIANLSDKSHYSYSPQEIDELFQAYEEKGQIIKLYFKSLSNEFRYSN